MAVWQQHQATQAQECEAAQSGCKEAECVPHGSHLQGALWDGDGNSLEVQLGPGLASGPAVAAAEITLPACSKLSASALHTCCSCRALTMIAAGTTRQIHSSCESSDTRLAGTFLARLWEPSGLLQSLRHAHLQLLLCKGHQAVVHCRSLHRAPRSAQRGRRLLQACCWQLAAFTVGAACRTARSVSICNVAHTSATCRSAAAMASAAGLLLAAGCLHSVCHLQDGEFVCS